MNYIFRMLCILMSILSACSLHATTLPSNSQKSTALTLYGYLKAETFIDSRQIVGSSQDQVLLYPERAIFDRCCHDINSRGQQSMTIVESRLGVAIDGPVIRRARSKACVEGDFLGTYDKVTRFRLRHAFFQLDWNNFSLIAGQTWHPCFIESCYADTVSFNDGEPFDPFARDPQVRGVFHGKSFDAALTLSGQVDYVNTGPIGPNTSYLRNSVTPDINAQIKTFYGEHECGFVVNYQKIVPRLETNTHLKVDESLASWVALFYMSLEYEYYTCNFKVTYAQNATNLNLIGGYAVHSVDPITDERTYTNLSSINAWVDMRWTHKRWEPGLFIGIAKNVGSGDSIIRCIKNDDGTIEPTVYGEGTTIDWLCRASPRIRWHAEPFVIGGEIEWTRATFGCLNNCGRAISTRPVNNIRLLAAFYYFF